MKVIAIETKNFILAEGLFFCAKISEEEYKRRIQIAYKNNILQNKIPANSENSLKNIIGVDLPVPNDKIKRTNGLEFLIVTKGNGNKKAFYILKYLDKRN